MKPFTIVITTAALVVLSGSPALGQSRFATIYSGAEMFGLTAGDQVLYGLGSVGCGSIDELKPPAVGGGAWTHTTLYTFTGLNGDGCGPTGPMAIAPDGTVYGVTSGGGTFWGTVYQLKPPSTPTGVWAESVLYTFPTNSEPVGLAMGPSGVLYLDSYSGGSGGGGFVSELQPPASPGEPWTSSVLYSFTGFDSGPYSLILGSNGVLYGTISFGGAPPRYAGEVFEIRPPAAPGGSWTESSIYDFRTPSEGSAPNSLIFAPDGSLYGTTFGTVGNFPYHYAYGIGSAFQMTPPSTPGGTWTLTTLAQLGAGNFRGPNSPLLLRNGKLYGSTSAGPNNPGGVVFELSPPSTPGGAWTTTYLHSFSGTVPGFSLVMDEKGALYGTTQVAGPASGQGIVYRIALE